MGDIFVDISKKKLYLLFLEFDGDTEEVANFIMQAIHDYKLNPKEYTNMKQYKGIEIKEGDK